MLDLGRNARYTKEHLFDGPSLEVVPEGCRLHFQKARLN